MADLNFDATLHPVPVLPELPAMYDYISREQRALVREEYARIQGGLCPFCLQPLEASPPPVIQRLPLDNRLWGPAFMRWPVHLHHDHKTGFDHRRISCTVQRSPRRLLQGVTQVNIQIIGDEIHVDGMAVGLLATRHVPSTLMDRVVSGLDGATLGGISDDTAPLRVDLDEDRTALLEHFDKAAQNGLLRLADVCNAINRHFDGETL